MLSYFSSGEVVSLGWLPPIADELIPRLMVGIAPVGIEHGATMQTDAEAAGHPCGPMLSQLHGINAGYFPPWACGARSRFRVPQLGVAPGAV
jgi:hypothetical protein